MHNNRLPFIPVRSSPQLEVSQSTNPIEVTIENVKIKDVTLTASIPSGNEGGTLSPMRKICIVDLSIIKLARRSFQSSLPDFDGVVLCSRYLRF